MYALDKGEVLAGYTEVRRKTIGQRERDAASAKRNREANAVILTNAPVRQNHCAVILTKVSVRQNYCVAIKQAKVSYKQRIPVNFAGNHSGTEFFIQESNIQAFS